MGIEYVACHGDLDVDVDDFKVALDHDVPAGNTLYIIYWGHTSHAVVDPRGNTWWEISLPASNSQGRIFFTHITTPYLAGDTVKIHRTSGASWGNPPSGYLSEVSGLDTSLTPFSSVVMPRLIAWNTANNSTGPTVTGTPDAAPAGTPRYILGVITTRANTGSAFVNDVPSLTDDGFDEDGFYFVYGAYRISTEVPPIQHSTRALGGTGGQSSQPVMVALYEFVGGPPPEPRVSTQPVSVPATLAHQLVRGSRSV